MNNPPNSEKTYDHSRLEFLYSFGRNLTHEAKSGTLNSFVGRDEEIQLVIETLCRKTKRNPVLVGAAGVGKTAIVEGLAIRIANDDVPASLKKHQIFSVPVSSLIGGATWYGMIEVRIQNLLAEARRPGVIVFIDELHTIAGTGPGDDSTRDVSQQLKPALARGEIILIGATTDDEYRKFIEADEALERRFQPLQVLELGAAQTFEILCKLRDKFTKGGQVEIDEKALRMILDYAERFMLNRRFPDKAIDLLEQTAAFAESIGKTQITAQDTEMVLQRLIGLPADLPVSLENLRQNLKQKDLLIGAQADEFCDFLSVTMQGFGLFPARPNAVLLMLNEAGKQAGRLAKTISQELFDSAEKVVKIDFGTLKDKQDLSRLIGAGPGLSGYGALLPIHKIAQTPCCVIVCQDIHAADISIQEYWAQAIADGYLTDSKGKRIYLSDAIVLLTANAPGNLRQKLGFSLDEDDDDDNRELRRRLEKFVEKNLIAYADLVVVGDESFTDKGRREWLKENLLCNLSKRLRRQSVEVHWHETLIRALAQKQSESNEVRDWERLINIWLMPALLPFLSHKNKTSSVIVKFDGENIIAEADEQEFEEIERLNFNTAAQACIYNRLLNWLDEDFFVQTEPEMPVIKFRYGAALMEIFVSDWKGKVLVTVQSRIVTEIEIKPEVLEFLLKKNPSLRFGKFALEADGTILLEHTMLVKDWEKSDFYTIWRSIGDSCQSTFKRFQMIDR